MKARSGRGGPLTVPECKYSMKRQCAHLHRRGLLQDLCQPARADCHRISVHMSVTLKRGPLVPVVITLVHGAHLGCDLPAPMSSKGPNRRGVGVYGAFAIGLSTCPRSDAGARQPLVSPVRGVHQCKDERAEDRTHGVGQDVQERGDPIRQYERLAVLDDARRSEARGQCVPPLPGPRGRDVTERREKQDVRAEFDVVVTDERGHAMCMQPPDDVAQASADRTIHGGRPKSNHRQDQEVGNGNDHGEAEMWFGHVAQSGWGAAVRPQNGGAVPWSFYGRTQHTRSAGVESLGPYAAHARCNMNAATNVAGTGESIQGNAKPSPPYGRCRVGCCPRPHSRHAAATMQPRNFAVLPTTPTVTARQPSLTESWPSGWMPLGHRSHSRPEACKARGWPQITRS